ncbi:hypothetical protein FACS1894176_04410 [Bacteroidia bacterium]|nr:hypothetical protein FACS1894176_04410 [Bacteroidia bacterium]
MKMKTDEEKKLIIDGTSSDLNSTSSSKIFEKNVRALRALRFVVTVLITSIPVFVFFVGVPFHTLVLLGLFSGIGLVLLVTSVPSLADFLPEVVNTPVEKFTFKKGYLAYSGYKDDDYKIDPLLFFGLLLFSFMMGLMISIIVEVIWGTVESISIYIVILAITLTIVVLLSFIPYFYLGKVLEKRKLIFLRSSLLGEKEDGGELEVNFACPIGISLEDREKVDTKVAQVMSYWLKREKRLETEAKEAEAKKKSEEQNAKEVALQYTASLLREKQEEAMTL